MPLAFGFALVAFNDMANIVITGVVRQVFSCGLTLLLWLFYRRWPAKTFRLAPHVGAILFACAAVTAADALLNEGLRMALDLPAVDPLVQRGAVAIRLSLYLAWTALYFMIRQDLETRDRGLRLAQAELSARETELSMLRAQVNPHFLFNALNSILAECSDNVAGVRAITRSLADYLRASLLQRDHWAPLGEEVDMISAYLTIEQVRFEKKLAYAFSVEPAARDIRVPVAVLLPLVENAVKYGMRTSPPPLRIDIAAALRDRVLILTVENSGRWVDARPGAADSTQIGLANLRRRLSLLHGDAASLTIGNDAGRVRVTVTLPAGEPPALS